MADDDKEIEIENALSLGIGRVARSHVRLDHALRNVHSSLTAPGLAIYLQASLSTDRLVEDCKVMIKAARFDNTEIVDASMLALDAAKESNKVRNRVVHDMWMRTPDHPPETPQWHTYRVQRGQLGMQSDHARDIGYIESALDQLQRANTRIFALGWAVREVLPFYAGGLRRPQDLPEWIAIMRDQFIHTPDGGIKATIPGKET